MLRPCPLPGACFTYPQLDVRVPMTDAVYEALQAHRRAGVRSIAPSQVECVLSLNDGGIVPGHIVRDWLEAAQRRAGMKVLGALHKLRHTFCSLCRGRSSS
jgi:hypothetical protein